MVLYLILALFVALLFYASYSIGSGLYLKAFCKKQTDRKVVAITFDDGPDMDHTPGVLDVLKSYGVPACFFCIGSKIEGNEALLQRICAEGHLVGNHSFSHSRAFPLFSAARMKKDLEACDSKFLEVLSHRVEWFRPPFGVTNPTVAKVVRKLGYQTIGWSIRSFDTRGERAEVVLKRIKRKLRPGSVILLHDRMPGSKELLTALLSLLKEEGYAVERVDRLLTE